MPENKEKELLRRWMALWAEIDKTYIGFLKRWDLSLNAYWVIEYLHNHPQGAEPAELADRINVMRQLITIILNDLEKRGFLLRRESELDHRRRIIRLSPDGELFAREVCDAMEQFAFLRRLEGGGGPPRVTTFFRRLHLSRTPGITRYKPQFPEEEEGGF